MVVSQKFPTFAPANVCRDGGMVDTRDLKSLGHNGCAGSSPARGTYRDIFVSVFYFTSYINKPTSIASSRQVPPCHELFLPILLLLPSLNHLFCYLRSLHVRYPGVCKCRLEESASVSPKASYYGLGCPLLFRIPC